MKGRSCKCLLVISIFILTPGLVRGQTGRVNLAPELISPPDQERVPTSNLRHRLPIAPPGTVGLQVITRAAGTIFSVSVTAISRRVATTSQAVATVAITFHIDNAIRGAIPVQTLTIS